MKDEAINIKKDKKIKIGSIIFSIIVVLFLASTIQRLGFKVLSEDISISQRYTSVSSADNFQINSIYKGKKLVDVKDLKLKGWEKSNTVSGYPLVSNGYSQGNAINIKPDLSLLFRPITVNFEVGNSFCEADITVQGNINHTLYAFSPENDNFYTFSYTQAFSVLGQYLIIIGAIIFFAYFISNNLIRLLNLEKITFMEIFNIGKHYIPNLILYGIALYGYGYVNSHIMNQSYLTLFDTVMTYNDIIAFITIVFLLSLGLKSLYLNKKTDKKLMILNWIIFVLNPFVSFWILESAYNPKLSNMELIYIGINAFILFLIQTLIYIISRKKRISMIAIVVISFAFGVANDALYILRDSPLIPAFFGSLGVAADVAKDTAIQLDSYALTSYSLAVMWLLALSTIKEDSIKISKVKYAKQVLSYIGVFAIIFGVSANYFIKQNGVGVNLWRPTRTYYIEGSPYSFYRIFANQIITAPSGYDKDKVEAKLEEYYNKKTESKMDKKPNIVVIQNESLADYYNLGDIKLTKNPLEFTRSLKENAIQGYAHMSVLGGGTVNSEYETLTSIPLTFYPLGAYPFQQYVKEGHESVARLLENQGYDTFITHPNKPTNYSRQEAWPNLGFKNMEFLDDYPQEPDDFERYFISDKTAYNKIISKYENKNPDKPLFSYLVTMQNHGGYDGTYGYDQVQIEGHTSKEDMPHQEYLSICKISDDDFKDLVEYFKNYDEPTIICIFGDHQPQNYDYFMSLAYGEDNYDNSDLFHTPLTIWANYDIEEDENVNISLNYLMPYLLEKAGGVKLSAYDKFLLDIVNEYPIISTKRIVDKNGMDVRDDEKFKEINKQINQIGYYQIKQEGNYDKYFNQPSE